MTTTTNKGYTLPTVNGDFGTWGTELNSDLSIVDLNLGGSQTISLAAGNVIASAGQSQYLLTNLNGTLTVNRTYTLPAVGGFYLISNQTAGSYTVTVACAGGGTSVVVPQSSTMALVCDGTNMLAAVTGLNSLALSGTLAVTGNATFAGTVGVTGVLSPASGLTVGGVSNPIANTTNGFQSVADGSTQIYNSSLTPLSLGLGVSGGMINFFYTSSAVGSISTNGSATAYNTTSDATLKIDDGLITADESGRIIDRIKARWFRWKDDPDGTPVPGFFAQQVARVFPWAVTPGHGRKGRKGYQPWQMDAAKMMPVVVAELQALRQRVRALEAAR